MFLLAGLGIQSGQGRKKRLQEQEAVDHMSDNQKSEGEEIPSPVSSEPNPVKGAAHVSFLFD